MQYSTTIAKENKHIRSKIYATKPEAESCPRRALFVYSPLRLQGAKFLQNEKDFEYKH